MGFLLGKRAVVVGLASNRSIAWGIARAMRQQGVKWCLAVSAVGSLREQIVPGHVVVPNARKLRKPSPHDMQQLQALLSRDPVVRSSAPP